MLTVREIAHTLKQEESLIDEVAIYLYPNKLVFTREEAIVIRDYLAKFGRPTTRDVGPYEEYIKLERMAAIYESRLAAIRERQTDCVQRIRAMISIKPSYQPDQKQGWTPHIFKGKRA
jgi:hypothetical protein